MLASARSLLDSNETGVLVLSRLEFLLDARLRGRPAVIGYVILGTFAVSLLVFFFTGYRRVERVLYFPREHGAGLVTEARFVTRHQGLPDNVTELVESVLLGPTRHDAARLFARGGSVRAALVRGHTLFLDLSSRILEDDPEVPLTGTDAINALDRSIRFNFPRLKEIVVYIDGQAPRFVPSQPGP